MQSGAGPQTCADIDVSFRDAGFIRSTPIEEGLGRFVPWYRDFYQA
jgi:UDP-glucuronate 4-epimerase